MSVGIEGRRQRGAVVQGFEVFASDGSRNGRSQAERVIGAWFSRCSHLMAVGIEGRRQRRGFLHWVFEVFSLVSRFEQLKVAGSAEQ